MQIKEVKFYPCDHDVYLKFAVIAAYHDGRAVLVRHKLRDTYEIPGGHHEQGETIEQTAKRELWEETGAVEFDLYPVCVYCVNDCGMLYYADVKKFDDLPESEIAEVKLFENCPENWTYPHIQPYLYEKVQKFLETFKV